MIKLFPGALVISLLFSAHGFRKGSLDTSGAFAAFAVGYLSLANDLKFFGILLLTFYFAGSRATKVKADLKSKLEEGHQPKNAGQSHLAGNRNAIQVLCNSFAGTVAAILFRVNYGVLGSYATVVPPTCFISDHRPRKLIALAAFFYSACMGDTLASELGMLAKASPRMIHSGKTVPPGTNGGVTWWGTAMSTAGGFFIGVIALLDLAIEGRGGLCLGASPRYALQLLALSTLAGALGSALDSLIGATCQQTLYSEKEKKVVKSVSVQNSGVKSIGGNDIFTNDQVNMLASSLVAFALTLADEYLL